MADKILSGVVSTAQQYDLQVSDLAPNNYLTIVWKDTSINDLIKELDIDTAKALQYTNELNNSIDRAIANNNVSYLGQNKFINIESLGKYIAQNALPAGTQRTVVNALIGVASGSKKKLPNDVANLCLNVFGHIADDTARDLGYTDPINIFSQVAGENVLGVLGKLGKNTKNFLDKSLSKINKRDRNNVTSSTGEKKNEKKYIGLLLGVTMSDTESYEIGIPRKKVEDGSDYTTHLLPKPFKKEFSVKLTNKILSSDFNQLTELNAIEYTKNKMIEIANSRTLFDIYIRLSADKMYKKSNVVFSSLSFTKDEGSGNSYTATFTIEPINSFKAKTFVSNRRYGYGRGTGANAGSGGSGAGSGKGNTRSDKTTGNDSIKVGYYGNENLKDVTMKNYKQVKDYANKRGFYLMEIPGGDPEYLFVGSKDVYAQINKSGNITKTINILKSDMDVAYREVGASSDLNSGYGTIYPKFGVSIDKKTGYITSNKVQYKLNAPSFTNTLNITSKDNSRFPAQLH